MRLGQLARKLSLRPNEIVEFLAANNIQTGDGSNARIADEHAMLVIKHLAPGMENLLKEEDEPEIAGSAPEALKQPEIIEDIEPIKIENHTVEAVVEAQAEEIIDKSDQAFDEESMIIKAPKVELPGLKVIGKIDLPDPKKKETPTEKETPFEAETPSSDNTTTTELPKRNQREDRRPYQKRERNELRPKKNPIALQRERESQEAEKKKRAEAEQAKEKRTNNYLKKVKPAPPTRAAKLMNEEYVEMHHNVEPKPTSWFGRLVRWFTKA
jgi:hypothetical protein